MKKDLNPAYDSPSGMLDWPCGVERLPNGNTLIADAGHWSGKGSEILEVDRLGNIVWQWSGGVIFAHSAKLMKNGNIIISDTGRDRVLEINRKGKVIWSSEQWNGGTGRLSDGSHLWYPNDVEETSRGKLLISDRNNNRMVEVDKQGNIIWEYSKLKHCHDADRLPNGNTLVASSDENKIFEIDPEGNVVWSYGDGSPEMLYWPRDADRLENGNTLIADTKNNRVIEVNKNGKIEWAFTMKYCAQPYEVDRLINGNTLISVQQRRIILEVDYSGNIIWQFRNYLQGHIQEYLQNGDFEQEAYYGAGYPAYWTKCPLLCESKIPILYWDSKVCHSGTHSIGVEYNGPGSVWWQQTVRVSPGKLYKLTDWIKTSGLEGFAQTQVAFLDQWGGFLTHAELLPGTKPRKGNSDWNSDSIEIRAPEEATAADIRCMVIGKGKVWFDSLTFEEVPWG